MISRPVRIFFALIFLFAGANADEIIRSENDYREGSVAPTISAQTTENLYLLGKVWGYLKYHHPRATSGCLDWDAQLLEVIDDAVAAENRDEASGRLGRWIHDLNDPSTACDVKTPEPVHFSVDKGWVAEIDLLGEELTKAMVSISARSSSDTNQHYVSLADGVGNPKFQSENLYDDMAPPDWRYRLVALYRFWNIIEYWSPYRNLIIDDWDEVLKEFVPRFVAAGGDDQYILELMALVARVEDSHANLWSSLDARPPAGTLNVPVGIRSIEGRPVIWRDLNTELSSGETEVTANGLVYGDVILAVDGIPVSELIESWKPYFGVSNHVTLLRETSKFLLRGSASTVDVRIERNGKELDLTLDRTPVSENGLLLRDRDGDTVQLLTDEIAYLKLSSVSRRDIPEYLDAIAGRKGLIIDIRNYPSDFVVFALGQHLVSEVTPFARFTYGDLKSPGTFHWTDPIELTPVEPFFDGRVVILVDESSQSQSEYTAMAFRSGPNAVVIGSQTAGADGNISAIPLPGGHETVISGIGVFYPDKAPTQQIGIVPDIVLTPTVAGVRAGRDEVLERAVQEIMSNEIHQDLLLEITRIPHAPKSTTSTRTQR